VLGTGGTVGSGNGGGLLVVRTTLLCTPGTFCTWVLGAGAFIARLPAGICGVGVAYVGTAVVLTLGVVGIIFWFVGGVMAIGALPRISTKEKRLSTKRIPRNSDSITSAGFNLDTLLCLAIFKYYS
jgi:hypothetical protein